MIYQIFRKPRHRRADSVTGDSIESITDYARQPFRYQLAKDNWHRAHAGFYRELAKYPYITFDKFFKTDKAQAYFPKSLLELQKIIKDNQGRKIRVSGGHHTFNDISITDDIIIRTFNLKKTVNLDSAARQVTVESGITLEELCMYLEEHNLAMVPLPAIPYQSIAGAIATSTHGSNLKIGTFSDIVMSMVVVLANGNIRNVDRDDPEFPAFATNLGALGAVYSVTLQCVPLFAMEHHRVETTWKQVKKNIPDLLSQDPYLQIYIEPYTPKLKAVLYHRRPLQVSAADLQALKGVGYPGPVKKVASARGIYYRILTKNEEAGYYTEEEVAIPFERVVEAVDDVLRLFQTHKKLYGYQTKKPLLIRFAAADYDSWLSLTSGRVSAFLDVYREAPFHDPEKHLKFFRDFEDLLIFKYKGRPHWGKRNFLDEYKTRLVYGLSVDYFNKVRDIYDPERMFSNDYIDRVLGP